MGQQRWLRTLNIEHHQILAGTDVSMAPGFESLDALESSKNGRRLLGQDQRQTLSRLQSDKSDDHVIGHLSSLPPPGRQVEPRIRVAV